MEEERGSRCPEVREQLSAYLEEELDGENLARVEGHLSDCESCRMDLELLRHTLGALRSLPEVPAPAAILQGVRAGTAPRGLHRRLAGLFGVRPAVGLPVGAAATLLVAFGVFLLAERFPDLGKTRPLEISEEDFREEAPENRVPAAPLLPRPPEKGTLPAGEPLTMPVPGPEAVKRGDDISAAGKVLPDPRQTAKVKDSLPRPSGAGPGPPQDEKLSTMDRDEGKLSRGRAPVSAPRRETPEEPTTEAPPGPAPALEEKIVSGREETTVTEGSPATMERESNVFADAPEPPGLPEKRWEKETGGAAFPEATGADGRRRLYRKSLPPRDSAETRQSAALRAAAPVPGEAGRERGDDPASARQDSQEVLTIVSFGDEEVQLLRESLEQTGGTLLEMKNLDTMTSQQVALPHQDRLPPHQIISRGWQARALLPLSRADEFVALLEGRSELQLLERVTVASPWTARPGTQLFEINLIR